MIASRKKTFPKNLGDNDWPIGMRLDGKLDSVEPPLVSLVDVLLGVRRWSLVSTSLPRAQPVTEWRLASPSVPRCQPHGHDVTGFLAE
jgi:hypothetical protein